MLLLRSDRTYRLSKGANSEQRANDKNYTGRYITGCNRSAVGSVLNSLNYKIQCSSPVNLEVFKSQDCGLSLRISYYTKAADCISYFDFARVK